MRVSVSVLLSTLGSQWPITRDVDREGAAVGAGTCSGVRSALRGRGVGLRKPLRAGSAVDATRAQGDRGDAQKRVAAVFEVEVSDLLRLRGAIGEGAGTTSRGRINGS